MKDTHIYLIEDDASMRESLMNVFKSLGYLAQAFSSAAPFLELSKIPQKSVLISDVRMPNMSGIELQGAIKQRYPNLPVILLSGECSVRESIVGFKQGAIEFLLKPFEMEDLLNAVDKAIRQQAEYLQGLDRRSAKLNALAKLANREREVAELMVAGYKNLEMAKKLSISVETVKQYRSNILSKLKLKTLAELVDFYRS